MLLLALTLPLNEGNLTEKCVCVSAVDTLTVALQRDFWLHTFFLCPSIMN